MVGSLSPVAMLSLISIGTPINGFSIDGLELSQVPAIVSASALSSRTELSLGPFLSKASISREIAVD